MLALTIALAGATALWALAAVSVFFGLRSLQGLDDLSAATLDAWPKLSVIVPALNEEATIEAALRSLLSTRYPNVEVLAIDDRSTDGTGAIIDRLAAENPRLRAIHLTELPAGWLGKVHALHRGVGAATGEWLLFTDADVHFAPDAFERLVAAAAGARLDHLAIFPRMLAPGLALQAVISTFAVGFALLVKPHRARDPRSSAAVGVGACNLVRRAAFDRTPGFEWLRMEVADDVGLGMMLKQHGGRPDCASALEHVAVEWYPTVGALVRGLEKNSYGLLSGYSLLRFSILLVLSTFLGLAPYALPLVASAPWAVALTLGAVVLWHAVHVYASVMNGHRVAAGLLGPFLGGAVMTWTIIRSAWRFARQGGAIWRGTLYPAAELRAGRRIKLI